MYHANHAPMASGKTRPTPTATETTTTPTGRRDVATFYISAAITPARVDLALAKDEAREKP